MEDKSPKRGRKLIQEFWNTDKQGEWKISPRRGDGNAVHVVYKRYVNRMEDKSPKRGRKQVMIFVRSFWH